MKAVAKNLLQWVPSGMMEHIQLPLYKNGYALIISSISTSGLGFFYWILAAHLFPAKIVGLNAAILSASLFISSVSQFNLNDALIRFLPTAGESTKRLIQSSYLISTFAILSACGLFFLLIPIWFPQLNFLTTNLMLIFGFVLFTCIYGIFALQDSALTGIRRTVWVPVENIVFSTLKIILLFVFAKMALQFGILASWAIPSVLIVLVVNVFLWSRFVPIHRVATSANSEAITVPRVAHYVAGDYLGGLFWVAVTTLQTLIVTQWLGATAGAHFYLVWQIAYGLFIVSRMMGMSLVAEGVTTPAKLDEYSFRALKQTFRIVFPAVIMIMIISPWLLGLYGQDYADHGSVLLRLLSLSAIPQVVIAVKLSVARIQRRSSTLFAIQASESIITFILMGVFLLRLGIIGLGWSWLLGQIAIAGVLVLPQIIKSFKRHFRLGVFIQLFRMLYAPWKKHLERQWIAEVNAIVLPHILPSLSKTNEFFSRTWLAKRIIPTVTGIKVFTLASDEQEPAMLLKFANSEHSVESLRSQARILKNLRADPRLTAWHSRMPYILADGYFNKKYYIVEGLLPGIDGRSLLWQEDARWRMLTAASTAIKDFHRCTMINAQANPRMLNQWVDKRLLIIEQAGEHLCSKSVILHLARLKQELYNSLSYRRLSVCLIHGDYAPGNILFSADGTSVEGVVDWDLAAIDLPQLDLMHLLLSTRMYITNREMGVVMCRLLKFEDWSERELDLLTSESPANSGHLLPMRTLILLCWLRHVSSNITKSAIYLNHRLWFNQNVETVLRVI